MFEYEAVCKRPDAGLTVPQAVVDDVLDYLAQTGRRQAIHFLWRPALPDAGDDHVLELAVAAGATVVTHNQRDFVGAGRFGVGVITPAECLRRLATEDER